MSKNIKLLMQILINSINAKQAELFSLQQRMENLMQIYNGLNNDFDDELNSALYLQNENYLKFLHKRMDHIIDMIEELKENEHSITEAIRISFNEKEKLKSLLKHKSDI